MSVSEHQLVSADALAALRKIESMEFSPEARALLVDVLSRAREELPVIVTSRSKTLTPAEAARMSGVSRATIQRLVTSGMIPATRVGNRYRIDLNDVVDYRKAQIAARERSLAELTSAAEADGTIND